jgi:hypothetical protein
MERKVMQLLDIALKTCGVHALNGGGAIPAFVACLGPNTETLTLQSPSNLGMTGDSIARPIKRAVLSGDQEGVPRDLSPL